MREKYHNNTFSFMLTFPLLHVSMCLHKKIPILFMFVISQLRTIRADVYNGAVMLLWIICHKYRLFSFSVNFEEHLLCNVSSATKISFIFYFIFCEYYFCLKELEKSNILISFCVKIYYLRICWFYYT